METLNTSLQEGFLSGVSLMPLLPFISDTGETLDKMFSKFSDIGARYVVPVTLTLFGNEQSDSKTLVMKAVKKHYPQLASKYEKFFGNSNEMPNYYRNAFYIKMKDLLGKYGLTDKIE